MNSFTIQNDEAFLRRAIRLAMNGRGAVEPNPMVGCVLVKDGQVIGEGYHARFGGPHAEPTALASCTTSPEGATAYVTLEPCCHTNKKTPPCVPALINAEIARVVAGCLDPNPDVNGQGLAQLRAAGIDVEAPLLEPEAKQLNAAFFAVQQHARPYVTLKWAQSADGKVAGPGGKRVFISNPASHRLVHRLRARCDAILVGIGTVLADDPLLTARDVDHPRALIRVVVDSDLRIPVTSRLARTLEHGPVRVYCSQESFDHRMALVAALEANGVTVCPIPSDVQGGVSLAALLTDLGKSGVHHLLVESGPTLAGSFLSQSAADRIWLIRSPNRIDNDTACPEPSRRAPAAQRVDYPATAEANIEGDRLTEYLNPTTPVFFARQASADFMTLVAT